MKGAPRPIAVDMPSARSWEDLALTLGEHLLALAREQEPA